MNKSDDIKLSDLLERVRKNLREQAGDPEPEVLTEDLIVKHTKDLEDKKRQNEERGQLIRELFGNGENKDDPTFIEDMFTPSTSFVHSDDDDLPSVLEDLASVKDEGEDDPERLKLDYDLISMFGMQDVEDEDFDASGDMSDHTAEEEELPPDFIEYENRMQIPLFIGRFKSEHKRTKIRAVLLALLLIVAFAVENVTLFAKEPVGFLSSAQYPTVYFLWGVQIILICLALMYKKVISGIVRIFKRIPNFDSVLAVCTVLTVIYMLCLAACGLPEGLGLFTLPMISVSIVSEVSDHMQIMRKLYSFTVLVDKNPKTVLEKQDESEIEQELAELDDFIDRKTNFLKVVRAEKITGFFKRFETGAANSALIRVCIPAIIFICVALGLITYIKENSFIYSLQAAMLGMGMAVPVCIGIAYSYPTYKMSAELSNISTAVLGNKALEEYSSPAVVQMKDTDIFPSKYASTVSVKTYSNAALDTVLHYCAAVFSPLGGPLGGMFRNTTSDYSVTNDVDYIRLDDDGIECAVEDHHIFVGKYSFINRCGYSLYKQTASDEEETGDTHSVFMVIDDKVVALIKVRYGVSEDVKKKLNTLSRAGIGVCVRTFDPNITTSMVMSLLGDRRVALRVIKCKKRSQRATNVKESASGIITSRETACLYTALACTERCKTSTKALHILGVLSMFIGFLVGYLLLTVTSVATVTSAPILLYQLIWMVLCMLISKLFG